MKKVYYNDNDPATCAWTEELIKMGAIRDGDIDSRDIRDIGPGDLKGYIQCNFFNGIAGWPHALDLAGWPRDRAIWTASLPCFNAATLVATERGLQPISDIKVGDKVLTHKGRYRSVRSVMQKQGETVEVRGQGVSAITTTAEHPFYARRHKKDHRRNSLTYLKRLLLDPEWINAENLKGSRWAGVTAFPDLPIPEPISNTGYFWDSNASAFRVKGEKNGENVYIGVAHAEVDARRMRRNALRAGRLTVRGMDGVDVSSRDFAFFLGYWVGDGWVTGDAVLLCGGRGERKMLEEIFRSIGVTSRKKGSEEPTGPRMSVGSKVLSLWLTEHFGSGASGKRVPAWLFGAPEGYRRAFLGGWILADGHFEANRSGTQFSSLTTTSKNLAISARILANQIGKSTCVTYSKPKRNGVTIEGRSVNERGFYRISSFDKPRSLVFADNFAWGLVRSVTSTGKTETVYNLEVADDNTYTADGIVVHNCQPFSDAGKSLGVNDERHLWPVFHGLVEHYRPECIVGEQVASKAGRAWFATVQVDLENLGYRCGAVDICAAGVGAPHIRQRLYWCAVRVGHADGSRQQGLGEPQDWPAEGKQPGGASRDGGVADGQHDGHHRPQGASPEPSSDRENRRVPDGSAGGLGHAERIPAGRNPGTGAEAKREAQLRSECDDTGPSGNAGRNPWGNVIYVYCADGKSRPIPRIAESKLEPLADELPGGLVRGGDPGAPQVAFPPLVTQQTDNLNDTSEARAMRLKGYGNSIVVPLAAEFIATVMEIIDDPSHHAGRQARPGSGLGRARS